MPHKNYNSQILTFNLNNPNPATKTPPNKPKIFHILTNHPNPTTPA